MNINSVVQRTVVTTERRHEIALDQAEIRELMRCAGYQIPAKARIYFTVPGGGDWSNTDVDITHDYPVTIEWTDISEQEHSGDGQKTSR